MREQGRTQSTGGGPALFRIVRYWSRRWQGSAGTSPQLEGLAEQVQHVQVLEAVDAALGRGEASVTAVADALGLDRSGASRLISAAARAGLIEKGAAADDARRAELAMTRQGHALLKSARKWQQAAFEQMLVGWAPADVRRFGQYLERLARHTDQLGASI